MSVRRARPRSQPGAGAGRLGLALSGGGSRAAAFHLGVLRGLRSAGLLSEVEAVSAVSGGAMLAGAFAVHGADFDRFDGRARRFLARDLKLRIALAALRPDRALRLLCDPRYSLTDVFADVLDAEILEGRTLGSLAETRPRLVVNATCINHGTGWRFTQERIGDWLLGTENREALGRFRLARAVAASAAFPGGFAPLVLDASAFGGRVSPPREVLLCDGGVDDNLGVHALAGASCEALVVSDGSSPFVPDPRPLDRFGLSAWRRLAIVLAALAAATGVGAWFGRGVGAAGLIAAIAVAGLLTALWLRLRLALSLFAGVAMRGQRRGVLRQVFALRAQRPVLYVGLASRPGAAAADDLRRRGVDPERLRRLPTDLALDARDVEQLAALGEALVGERLREWRDRTRGTGRSR
ncbi:MAG: patatin-like phospholipase family protein [Vicinamibacteria bacterium]